MQCVEGALLVACPNLYDFVSEGIGMIFPSAQHTGIEAWHLRDIMRASLLTTFVNSTDSLEAFRIEGREMRGREDTPDGDFD